MALGVLICLAGGVIVDLLVQQIYPVPPELWGKAPMREILAGYVEHDLTRGELVAAGFDPDVVARITRLVDVAEWKRRNVR